MEVDILGWHISLVKLLNPIFYILFILGLDLILGRILKAIFHKAAYSRRMSDKEKHRVQTIHGMIRSIIRYVTLILIFLVVLASLGVNVTSLVAGLGILTAVLGLAFQDMIKDIIAGITIITEGQFSVGDTVEINGFKGEVLSVGLKTTQVKNYRGEVKVISNRNIDNLINYSKFDTYTEVQLWVSYESDQDKVTEILQGIKQRLDGKIPQATGEITLTAMTGFDERGVSYTMACQSAPADASDVQTALRREIFAKLGHEDIKISYPHVAVEK